MTWQVFVRAAAESDLENLSDGEQQTLVSEMFAWVHQGPPRQTPRNVLGVEMFDDQVGADLQVTYVIDANHERILVVRIRKARRSD